MTRSSFAMISCWLTLFLLTSSDVHGSTRLRRDDARPKIQHRKLLIPSRGSKLVDQQYLIILNDDVKNVDAKVEEILGTSKLATSNKYAKSLSSDIVEVNSFNSSIMGFTMTNVSQESLQILLEDEDIKWIEQDQIVTINAVQSANVPWHLDRSDDSSSERIDYSTSKVRQYVYSTSGAGVTVYVLDTGIRMSHSEFGGRAQCAYDVYNTNCSDRNGHGTHVAGIVGGINYGAAKTVNLMAVKVLKNDGSGTWSAIISGIDFVTRQKKNNPAMRIIINLSLGGGNSEAVNAAVQAAVDADIVVVVAAGNDKKDACQFSPASATAAITVGSTTSFDQKSLFSNIGACLDIFAPGSSILSAGISSDTAMADKSGTSMSSPLVAGVAALYMEQYPTFKPLDVVNAIKAASYKGANTIHETSPNEIVSTITLLTFSRPTPSPTRPPTKSPTKSPIAAPLVPPLKCNGFMGSCTGHKSCCSRRCLRLVRRCF